MLDIDVLVAEPWSDYELLDSGAGRKLERFADRILDRPDSQAIWAPGRPDRWREADARFDAGRSSESGDDEGKGRWEHLTARARSPWPVTYGAVTAEAQLTGFRHVGLFPEQRVHWDLAAAAVGAAAGSSAGSSAVLNLFGYTGMASLLAAASGARVTHVDASRKAIGWARSNQAASGLAEAPVRWICDDAARFTAREVRRGQRYDGIVLDPPKYGRGPKGEIWRLEDQLPDLLADCRRLLDSGSAFLVLTAYATHLSVLTLRRLAEDRLGDLPGRLTAGEMALRETGSGRLLPTSLYVRWTRDG